MAFSLSSINYRAGGHGHHMFALLYPLTHWSLLNLGEIPADKTCTSLPQAWSVPRGNRIEPEPVMKCSSAQAATDQVGKRKRPPVSCKLYDARSKRIKKMGWKPEVVLDLCNELAKSVKPPPFSYLLSDQEVSSVINTVIGNVPLGSYLGHQLFDKKKSQTAFNVDRPVEKMIANQGARIEPFPDLPLVNVNNSFIPPVLDQPQNAVIKKKVTINFGRISTDRKNNCSSISGARIVVSKKQETNSIQFWQSYKKKKTSH